MISMIPEQHRQKAAWVGICLGLCAGSEGLRQTAYQDVSPMRVWTACFGETKGIKPGDHFTVGQCQAMLAGRLLEFASQVEKCTTVPLPPAREAAMVDFAYNEGAGRYCKYIAPKLNAGQTKEACDKLLQFTTAGGITFPGLVTRRAKERDLCMEDLS